MSVTPRRSALLLDKHLTGLAEGMTVELIMTPRVDLVTVEPGATTGDALALLGDSFDQLPVTTGGRIVGMVRKQALPETPEVPLIDFVVPAADLGSLRSTDGFFPAVEHLMGRECTLIFDPATGDFCGLLHFTDLNRQAVRIYAYLWLSALEMGLAEYLHRNLPDMDDWLHKLAEFRQMTVLGRYEFDRRRHIEISPIEGLDLSDLTKLCGTIESLREGLGFSKTQFDKRVGRIVDLRNAAMHPVRSMIRSHSDVESLGNRLTGVRELVRATMDALNES